MELIRKKSRAMIYYDFQSGLIQKQLVEGPSKTTIYRWFLVLKLHFWEHLEIWFVFYGNSHYLCII